MCNIIWRGARIWREHADCTSHIGCAHGRRYPLFTSLYDTVVVIMPNHIRFTLLYLFLLIASPAMSSPYHGDHLGSASWITEHHGVPVQYIHYAPYGEFLAYQRPCNYDERFKFTGKERDYESGYDFFGARYFSSVFGHWLSVDPLTEKYPIFFRLCILRLESYY